MDPPAGYPFFIQDNSSEIIPCDEQEVEIPDSYPEVSEYEAKRRKRAVIIGINYSGSHELKGSMNDAMFMCHLIRTKFGFPGEEILFLADEPLQIPVDIKTGKPTFAVINEAISWLVRDSDRGDSLFFYFSGHGHKVLDFDGDEPSGFDTSISPVDFTDSGYITDDDLFHNLVKKVPVGARLTCIVDACLSGSVFDLPYMHDAKTRKIMDHREEELATKTINFLRKWGPLSDYEPRPDSKGGEVLCFAASKEYQSSEESRKKIADVEIGVFTYCIVETLEKQLNVNTEKKPSYRSILMAVEEKVKTWSANWENPQTPIFSTAQPFNLDSPVLL